MIKELLYAIKGTTATGQRVLSVENGIPKFEISILGTGIFTGSLEVTEMFTYWTIQRSNGTSYGEGKGMAMTRSRW